MTIARELAFTTSWDDGHPLDLRVAELLARRGFTGTFYVPRRNLEGRAVLTTSELRTLGAGVEIGGHTADHVRLDRLDRAERRRQIDNGKHRLEDELGRAIEGFSYPWGVHDAAIRDDVRASGFGYARTICNLRFDVPADRFQIPTTLQLYPHRRRTYAANLVGIGAWSQRLAGLPQVFGPASLHARLEALLHRAAAIGGVFHVWGHSWELQEAGLWEMFDAFLARVAEVVPPHSRVTNAAAYAPAAATSVATNRASNRSSV